MAPKGKSKKRKLDGAGASRSHPKCTSARSEKNRDGESQQTARRRTGGKRPSSLPLLRHYSNKDIEERVFKLFLHSHIQLIFVSLIHAGPLVRPPNDINVLRISADLANKGFMGIEAIAVWQRSEDEEDFACFYGNQRYLGQQLAKLRQIPSLVIDDMPHPTEEDLEYAGIVASAYSPQPAPKSFISHIVEVRTIVKCLLNRRMEMGSIGIEDVIGFLRQEVSVVESPILKHWFHGKGRVDKVNKVLKIAKVIITREMENLIDDIERTCFDPVKQVSRNALMDVKSFELLEQGAGRQLLQRYLNDLNKPCSSNKNKKLKLAFTPNELEKFNRLKNSRREGTGGSRRGSSNSQKTESIKKLENSLSILKEGISGLEQCSSENRIDVGALKKVRDDLTSALNTFR